MEKVPFCGTFFYFFGHSRHSYKQTRISPWQSKQKDQLCQVVHNGAKYVNKAVQHLGHHLIINISTHYIPNTYSLKKHPK